MCWIYCAMGGGASANYVTFLVLAWKSSNMDLILNLSLIASKRHIVAWFHVFWAIARKNPLTGLTCRRVEEKKMLYFIHLPRSSQCMNLYQIWYGGFSRGLAEFFCRSIQWYRFYVGLNLPVPSNWRSPLTSELPFRLWFIWWTCATDD